jgi:hypothetical protein
MAGDRSWIRSSRAATQVGVCQVGRRGTGSIRRLAYAGGPRVFGWGLQDYSTWDVNRVNGVNSRLPFCDHYCTLL